MSRNVKNIADSYWQFSPSFASPLKTIYQPKTETQKRSIAKPITERGKNSLQRSKNEQHKSYPQQPFQNISTENTRAWKICIGWSHFTALLKPADSMADSADQPVLIHTRCTSNPVVIILQSQKNKQFCWKNAGFRAGATETIDFFIVHRASTRSTIQQFLFSMKILK